MNWKRLTIYFSYLYFCVAVFQFSLPHKLNVQNWINNKISSINTWHKKYNLYHYKINEIRPVTIALVISKNSIKKKVYMIYVKNSILNADKKRFILVLRLRFNKNSLELNKVFFTTLGNSILVIFFLYVPKYVFLFHNCDEKYFLLNL